MDPARPSPRVALEGALIGSRSAGTPTEATLASALAAHGLRLRGGFAPQPQDALPALPEGRVAAWVWMVGQVGSESWNSFKASSQFSDGLPDPLDRWSQALGDALARRHGGLALYPFGGPPWHPFQQWAARAEPLGTSPLMLLIHPHYGLWHAYRFALALPEMADGEAAGSSKAASGEAQVQSIECRAGNDGSGLHGLSDICARCDGQPCLRACPVDAFTGSAYLVDACAAHLHRAQGRDCMQLGCQARRACPVGAQHRYGAEQAAFHMAAFAKLR